MLLLGRYSPPFLDWVESAQVSTSKATLPGAFRGTTQWVAWFKLPEPIWLAGWSVLSSPVGILLGWLLITIAVLGMLRADIPNRRFLIGASIGGLVLLTAGHTGALTPPWADGVQNFLDGVGAVAGNTKVGNRHSLLGLWQHIDYVTGFNLDRRLYDVLRCMPTVPGAVGEVAVRRAPPVSTMTKRPCGGMSRARSPW